MMILVITDSWDYTSDLVIRSLHSESFRLNTDMIIDYKIDISPNGFKLTNPADRSVHSSEVKGLYWRKPFTDPRFKKDSTEKFFFSEAAYAVRELCNICRINGANFLVEPGAERRLGKPSQLILAAKHFSILEWNVTLNCTSNVSGTTVAKSLSSEQLNNSKVLYTTIVDKYSLDTSQLWYTQKFLDADSDVTVVYVDGEMFGYRLRRTKSVVDWREKIGDPRYLSWDPFNLEDSTKSAIVYFMNDCRLRFGRIEFLEKDGNLYFLEVNPNGQWAWLDSDQKHGLVARVCQAIEG